MAGNLSFAGKERLKSPRDFKRVCSRGKRIRTENFIIYALPNDLGLPRLGLTVSAKTANSPGRSRIKRLLREFFRLNKACFTIKAISNKEKTLTPPFTPYAPAGHAVSTGHDMPGSKANALDVVISAKGPAARLGLKDVEEELAPVLLKIPGDDRR